MHKFAADSDTGGCPSENVLEHPVVWDFVGKDRYLQAAVSKSLTHLYATKFGPTTSKKLSNTAAQDGCAEVLLWSRSIGCSWDESLFLTACGSNRINILEQLYMVGDESVLPGGTQACTIAASVGHISVIHWLREHGCRWDEDVCDAAAQHGQLAVLEWLFANGAPFTEDICEYACASGELAVLQFLYAQGCALTAFVVHIAIRHSSIEVLRWLHENNAPFGESSCAIAASVGSLEKLQFLRASGCPWNYLTVEWSRGSGFHHIAQWAIENGCPEFPDDDFGVGENDLVL